RALHGLLRSGSAGRFSEIVSRPGLPHALVRTLEELRAAGISAEALRAIPVGGPDLAAILERVERELEELGLADHAQLFSIARAVIERDGTLPAGIPTLMLDLGPESYVEQDLVRALVARAPLVLATAPEGDTAIERLEAILGAKATQLDRPPRRNDSKLATSSSLARLQRHVFEESGPEPRVLDGSVSLTSWP